MLETEVTVKKWGSSLGIVIPKNEAKKEGIKEGQKIRIRIVDDENPLKKMFGTFKSKKSTAKLMRETDRELYYE